MDDYFDDNSEITDKDFEDRILKELEEFSDDGNDPMT